MERKFIKYSSENITESGEFTGYASVFDNVDYDRDVVVKGAFEKSLACWREKGQWPTLFWNHDSWTPPPGVYTDMRENDKGLFTAGRLFIKEDIRLAKEIYTPMKAGAVSGMSIGYRVIKSTPDTSTNITYLEEIDLQEVSLVNRPANDLARLTDVKSIKTIRDFERFLRDAGYSRSDAVTIASYGFNKGARRDSGIESEINKLIQTMTGE